MSLALLDADIIAFRASAGAQDTQSWEDGPKVAVTDVDKAVSNALRMVKEWTSLARCSEAICCFSSGANFRKAIYPDYKANRKAGSKPLAYAHVVAAITAECRTHAIAGLEADDVMGIMGTSPSDMFAGAVIVTQDKDLLTVPGMHFNPFKDLRPHRVSTAKAAYQWAYQTLMGDNTDNIKGIPGWGPVAADNWIAMHGSSPEATLAAYLSKGLGVMDFILNARLTRILHHQDYHPDTQEITLWHPTDTIRHQLGQTTATSTAPSVAPSPGTAATASATRKSAAVRKSPATRKALA